MLWSGWIANQTVTADMLAVGLLPTSARIPGLRRLTYHIAAIGDDTPQWPLWPTSGPIIYRVGRQVPAKERSIVHRKGIYSVFFFYAP